MLILCKSAWRNRWNPNSFSWNCFSVDSKSKDLLDQDLKKMPQETEWIWLNAMQVSASSQMFLLQFFRRQMKQLLMFRLVNVMGSHLKLRRHMRLLGLMRRTSLSPHGQILVLLDIQHQLQPISHSSFHGDQQWPSILSRVEGVAFSVACEDLKEK